MKKLVVAVCTIVMALGLFACSGGSSSSAASGGVSGEAASSASASAASQSFGWISFEVPEGWADTQESDKYVTIAEEDNSKHMMKFMVNSLTKSYPTAADLAAKDIASDAHDYADAGKKTIGNYEWSLASFEFNGNPSFVAYTDITEDRCLKITVYEMDLDDPAVQTAFNSITINEDELW